VIKVWDYLKELEEEKNEIRSAIEAVLTSGWLILGDHVMRFEDAFAQYCGVSHGIGVNSGTDAIFLALKALGIGRGDEVITVSNTAVPTVSAIVSTGAVPRFVDIDSRTYLMDTSLIEDVITEKTRCILPVHLYGQCVDIDAVNRLADKYSLSVLEDCAQSHGADLKGEKAGSLATIAAFSFYPTKILGGYGDAGMVVTNDEGLFRKVRRLRFYGMEKDYYSYEHGYNSRLDELHASILLKKLEHLEDYLSRRREIAALYDEALDDTPLVLPYRRKDCSHAFYLYVCRHHERDQIITELARKNIHLNISYPWPVHIMEGYSYLGYSNGDLPRTESAAKEIFSLPMYPGLGEEDQLSVISALKDYFSVH
jgi:aminotransferase EvaB